MSLGRATCSQAAAGLLYELLKFGDRDLYGCSGAESQRCLPLAKLHVHGALRKPLVDSGSELLVAVSALRGVA